MKRILFTVFMLLTAAVMFSGCGAPAGTNAAGNSANKPANAANAANTATAPAADKAAAEADIKKMLDGFAAALNAGDAAALDKYYADDYVLIDQNGASQTKAARIESVKSGQVKMEGLKFDDIKLKVNPTGDAAVAVGHVTGKNVINGKSEERNSIVTWVVVKDKEKGWRFINAQITDIKPGAAAPAKTDEKKDDKKADTAPVPPAANK